MAEYAQFWNRLADRYAAQPVADETSYRIKLDATRRLLRPDMDIFEFGCGTGSTALIHAPHVRHITAVDFSGRMVEIARAKAEAEGVRNVTFNQADIVSMPVEPERYDVVMGHSILHLLSDPAAAIRQSHAMLKPGGYFITSTACLGDGPMAILGLLAPLGRAFGLLPMLKVMRADELSELQREAGFAIEHRWRPARDKAVFFIARKPHSEAPHL